MKQATGRWIAAWCTCAAALACQPDWLAGPCNRDNPDAIYNGMKPKDGDNYISQNPALFTACDNFLCLSSNGSIPYCTKACASNADCANNNNVEMECRVVTEFGPLACRSPANEFCDVAGCKAACTGADKAKCEEACDAELCCERDAATHGVTDPATYCLAKDGFVPHDPKAQPIGS